MGSFNVSCCISKISIHDGEPVVYIPLELSKIYENRMGYGQRDLLFPWAYFRPITLPIIGQYDGSGSIEKIETNLNIRLIEDFFDATILDIVDMDTQPDCVQAGCFIHKEIYDMCISSPIITNFGKELTDIRSTYSEAYERVRSGMDEHGTFYEKALKINLQRLPENERKMVMDALMKTYQGNNPFNFYTENRDNVSRVFADIYVPAIKKGLLKEELIDFRLLEDSMWVLSAQYGPVPCGDQNGNDYMSRLLFRKSLEIVEKKIEERELVWNYTMKL